MTTTFNEFETRKLHEAMEIVGHLMRKLDKGVMPCQCCGKIRPNDPEARAKWEMLNAAHTRLEKVANWVPWEQREPAEGEAVQ